MSKITLAIIGGGAQAEGVYLPILTQHSDFQLNAIVEFNNERREFLQTKFNIPVAVGSVEELATACEAAIIAVPNNLHAAIGVSCLNSNIHTLMEKPLAITTNECDDLLNASQKSNARLMVAMVRRYYDNVRQVRHLIESGSLGKLLNIEIEEGYVFNWPVASDSLTNKNKSGGGVLIDVGVHVLDVLYYWLGAPSSFDYYDDSPVGIEAECRLNLSWPSATRASILLSRLRNLSNGISLTFESARVRIDIRSSRHVAIEFDKGLKVRGEFVLPTPSTVKLAPFIAQLTAFADLINNGMQPASSLSDARAVIDLISRCYDQKKNLSDYYLHF